MDVVARAVLVLVLVAVTGRQEAAGAAELDSPAVLRLAQVRTRASLAVAHDSATCDGVDVL